MRPNPSPTPRQATIPWRGKRLTVVEAGALAMAEQQRGNVRGALEIYDLIVARLPHSVQVHNNRSFLLLLLKRYEEALAGCDRAIALKPDYANSHSNRGLILKMLRRYDESLASYDRAIALNPAQAEAHNNRGSLLQDMRLYDQALASYDQALALKPDYALAFNNRGTALMNLGNMAEAEKMFRKALELKPDFSDPLHSLSIMRRFQTASDPGVQEILALSKKPGLPPENQEHLYFTLGKIYDESGLHDEAFGYYQQANEIRNGFVSYHAEDVAKFTNDLIEVFNRDFLDQRFAFSSKGNLPLFIVGMPRSGTTLLASMLSNHPAIATVGELTEIADYTQRLDALLQKKPAYPQAARRLTPAVAEGLISDYEKRLRRDARPAAIHVIDKNPLNFRHLGFIAMLFPRAQILHCQRYPLDTGLSNYFTRFPLSLSYAFNLRNIGHFYGEYTRLMAHWRTIPALKILDVRYEDMILRTEPTARAVLEFLGLEWDERCLAPHTNSSPVETASQWQVRQPIYKNSLDKWRHYEKHLGPLKEALAAANVFV